MNSEILHEIALQLPAFIADWLRKEKAANVLLKDFVSQKKLEGTALDNGLDLDYDNIELYEDISYENSKIKGLRWRMPYRVMPDGTHFPFKRIEGIIQEMPIEVSLDNKTLKPVVKLSGKFSSVYYVHE